MPPTASQSAVHRFNMALPEALYTELKRHADKHHTTITELIRKFITLGLMVLEGHIKLSTVRDGVLTEVEMI